LSSVLGSYFKREFAKLYERNDNSLFATNNPQALANSVKNKLSKLESNFMAFVQRKVESTALELPSLKSSIDEEESSSESDVFSPDSPLLPATDTFEKQLNKLIMEKTQTK